jgi:DNA repair exonuclease SbcCD ATPase subunit
VEYGCDPDSRQGNGGTNRPCDVEASLGEQAMSEIEELERRISAAFERIREAIDGIGPAPESGGLEEALQAEKDAHAQLAERFRALKERESAVAQQLQERARQLDAQGLELQRMRKNVIQLRETVRALREAQSEGLAEPHLLNRAMLAELETLRAARLSEIAEMDEILSELKPLLEEPQDA